jgi:hypothetical protein
MRAQEVTMNQQTFDSLTQQAARGLSRRSSLAALGASGMAALASPLAGSAKNKKKCREKDKDCPSLEEICAPQVEECKAIVAAVCSDGPRVCARLVNCCEVMEACDASAFILCLGAQPPPV